MNDFGHQSYEYTQTPKILGVRNITLILDNRVVIF